MFYAVVNGRTPGIFLTWAECYDSVKGYKKPIYKKFATRAEAEFFISINTPGIVGEPVVENPYFDFTPDYCVYTDGACSNNGRKNANAGIGIYFGENDQRNLSKKITGKQTNNVAELTAIIETYPLIETDVVIGKKIVIFSDSEYAIKCVSTYGEKCERKKWTMEIPNKELVKTVYELYKNKTNIRFHHIRAHTDNTDIHSIGNANADKLANIAIGLEECPYSSK